VLSIETSVTFTSQHNISVDLDLEEMPAERKIEDNIKADLWRIIFEDVQWIFHVSCAIVCFGIGGVGPSFGYSSTHCGLSVLHLVLIACYFATCRIRHVEQSQSKE
jgi:hypothetical protein